MFLNSDFGDLLRLLNAKGAKYLIVGGYAVGAHGEPRGTKDLDIWIGMSVSNAQKVIDVLTESSGEAPGVTAKKFASPGSFMTLGKAPNRVDILADIDGCVFDRCYGRRVMMNLGDVTSPVISLKDLIVNKVASGRKQDLADVEKLKKQAAKLAKKKMISTETRKTSKGKSNRISYNALLAEVAPQIIESEREHERIVKMIDKLMLASRRTAGEEKLLKLLVRLSTDYTERTRPADFFDAEPREVILDLLKVSGRKRSELLPIFGHRSTLSQVLSGKRGVSRSQIKALAEFFDVPVSTFV